MPGITSTADLFRSAGATIVDQLGERSAISGDYKPLKYTPPGGSTVMWPYVAGEIRYQSINPVTGELERRELLPVEVDSALMAASGVTSFQFDAVVETPDGLRWTLSEEDSTYGNPAMNTLGLLRQPAVRMNEVRRAAV